MLQNIDSYSFFDKGLVPVLVIGSESEDYYRIAYHDLKDCPGVHVVPKENGVKRFVKRIHLSEKISRLVKLPFQHLWVESDLRVFLPYVGVPSIVLLIESPEARNSTYVSTLRNYLPDAYICLNVLNPIERNTIPVWLQKVAPIVDLVVTCSQDDAETYGWKYWPDSYSKVELPNVGDASNDIVFIAKDKNRSSFAYQVYLEATARGLKCDFIIERKGFPRKLGKGFKFTSKPIPYEDYLIHINNSRCLLEIVLDGLGYSTLRTMEALLYGKKLLTTNDSVSNEQFYNAEQISIVRTPADVVAAAESALDHYDVQTDVVEYFSPNRLVEWLRETIMVDRKSILDLSQ